MAERGIQVSKDSILAIMAGRKWETRRLVPVPPDAKPVAQLLNDGPHEVIFEWPGGSKLWRVPYAVGDTLYFREALRSDPSDDAWTYEADGRAIVIPRNENERVLEMRRWVHHRESSYCHARYMPKWAARFPRPPVVSLRLEHLQDLTDDGARAEGIPFNIPPECCSNLREEYFAQWDRLNERRGAAETNPWVLVVEFERVVQSADPRDVEER